MTLAIAILVSFSLRATCEPQPAAASYNQQAEIGRGVVVERVASLGEGEKAGLREGDIVLSWSNADSKGEIQSPVDLAVVESEQSPRGLVKLEGLRGTKGQVWLLGADGWGLTARPNFSNELLAKYLGSQQLVSPSKPQEILEAAERWRALARRYSSAQPRWLPAWLSLHAAELLKDGKQWKEADDAYQSATEYASGPDSVLNAYVLQAWASAYEQRHDWASAQKCLQRAITALQPSGGSQLAVGADLSAIGRIWFQRGDLGQAAQYFQEALTIQTRLAPGSLGVAATFNGLGVVSLYQGELGKAEDYHHQALTIREKLAPESLAVAASLNNLGIVAKTRGDLATAEQYQRRGLTIREKLAPGSLDVARGLGNLGLIAYARGDLAGAERYLRQTLEIQEKLSPGSLDVASSLTNLGVIEQNRGDLAGAENYHLQALAIREKLAPGKLDVALSLNNLGVVSELRRDLDKAYDYHKQALDIRHKVAPGTQDEAASYDNLGGVAVLQGKPVEADKYYQQAFAIKEKVDPGSLDIAETLQGLGNAAGGAGNWSKAEEYYRRALAIRQKLAPGSTRHAESLAGVASALRAQHQLESAAQFYSQALSAFDKQTARLGGSEGVRSDFRASHSDIYREYVDLLLEMSQPERAFEVLEHSRARGLLEMLDVAHVDIHKGADPALLEQERSLQISLTAKSDVRLRLLEEKNSEKQVAVFSKEIEDLEKQYQDIEGRLRLDAPAYAALTHPQSLTLGEIQHLLDGDTVLLEYFLGEEHSYVFAVSSTLFTVHELPKRAELEEQARALYSLLTMRNRRVRKEESREWEVQLARADTASMQASAKLGRILLGSVGPQLGSKRLAIIAEGALLYVPFAALPEPSGLASGRSLPLVVRHEIANLPSASTLAALRQPRTSKKQSTKEVVVFADPVFDAHDERVAQVKNEASIAQPTTGKETAQLSLNTVSNRVRRSAADLDLLSPDQLQLPRLGFSRREADVIIAASGVQRSGRFVDFEANRKTAVGGELAKYRIVHFATHALVDDKHPELSGLVLSLVDRNGSAQDGFLDLQDIYNLDLAADLVVLSACDTALGKQVDGEGMIGLNRGFMYAGASRVLGSLWGIDDFATANFMKAFYKAMEEDKMPPAQALRYAQLKLWREKHWSAPYYWSAFSLQGDWK